MLFHVVNERHRRKRAMIFTTNKALKAWGGVLHDEDLAQAIIDRVLERGRLFRLDGPSLRTLHVNLDDALNQGADRPEEVIRISGSQCPEFPDPSCLDSNDVQRKRKAEMWCKQRRMEYVLATVG